MADIQKQIQKFPKAPGVYFFLGPHKKILYIGKATSLRDRVRSYFTDNIAEKRSPLIERMVKNIVSVDFQETDSALEAILLESRLIKTHKPRYNTDSKDDKSFNYVVITNEDYPRVLLVRSHDLHKRYTKQEIKYLFGPFPSGGLFKEALRLIRKIFPFYDTKHPVKDMKRSQGAHKIRFNRQIGLYPRADMTKKEYGRTIQHLRLFFEGKKKQLLKRLEKEMKEYAKEEAFEKAGETKRRIFALQHIQDVSLIREDFKRSYPSKQTGIRIEGYDIAHLAGENTVGVMTVVVDGKAEPSQYRKFIIREAGAMNDPAALAEILTRRLGHAEWNLPRIIAVDGSTAQINAAKRVLKEAGIMIPVVGVVKDEKHRPREIRGRKEMRTQFEKDILIANSEAHRFALSFHRSRRRKNI